MPIPTKIEWLRLWVPEVPGSGRATAWPPGHMAVGQK